jgi:ribose 5-phosphate isomerase B
MKIVIGADHRGFAHKEVLKRQTHIAGHTLSWIDAGAFNEERSDYPEYAQIAAGMIIDHEADCGILLCATGVGMAVAANRFPHIYAAVVWNNEVARRCKEDDNTNILVIPSDFVSDDQIFEMVRVWLEASFKGGRYQQRLSMIDE